MIIEHPSYHVRFYVQATILGIGIHLSLHELTHGDNHDRVGLLDWLSFIFYVLTAINFFHGKVLVGDDLAFRRNLVTRPFIFFIEFFSLSAVFISIAFAGSFLLEPKMFLASNIAVRIFDLILVNIALLVNSSEGTKNAQIWWHFIDVIGLFLFGTLLSFNIAPLETVLVSLSEKDIIQLCFILYIATDVGVDYAQNIGFFWPKPNSWNEMARLWDVVQGEEGDVYRRRIIVPIIVKKLQDIKIKKKSLRILDLGCGNGCITRKLAEHATSVIGVDKEPEMIKFAETYKQRNKILHEKGLLQNIISDRITFIKHDLDKGLKIDNGDFDVIIACFSLQDATSLKGSIQTIKSNLKANGQAFIIFENDEQFIYNPNELTVTNWQRLQKLLSPSMFLKRIFTGLLANLNVPDDSKSKYHLTSRKWIDPVINKQIGNGRKAIIFWGRKFAMNAQIDRPECVSRIEQFIENETEFVTLTRHWTKENYITEAKKIGLKELSKLGADPIELPEEEVSNLTNKSGIM